MVGSAYEVDGERFRLRLAARAEEQPMETVLFDLTALRSALLASAKADPDTRFPVPRPITCKDMGACGDFGVEALVRVLAVGGDSAAQTFIGSEMRRARRFDDTVGWLEQAARANNGLAQLILAEVFLERALRSPVGEGRTEWLEAAERRLLLAINAGFDTAMCPTSARCTSPVRSARRKRQARRTAAGARRGPRQRRRHAQSGRAACLRRGRRER